MLRKIGLAFFGSCLPDRNKVSAKAIILSIKDASLATLQLRLTDEYLTARTDDGLTPVLAACLFGREDVLAWLVTERHQSLSITDNQGNGPAELAVKHGRHGILKQLYLPTASGGLGWTPEKNAGLRNFPYDRDAAQHITAQTMMYFIMDGNQELVTTNSHVMVLDLTTQEKTDFNYGVTLAEGAFGKVSWYQAGKQIKLVKTPHSPVWQRFKSNDAAAATFSNTYLLPENTNYASFRKRLRREYKFTCLANPQYGPYAMQLLQKKQGDTPLYSYAFMMSIIPGSYPSQEFIKMASPLAAAKLILRMIEAINHLHQDKQIIHGDIRDKNILVISFEKENEIDYEVILIDFAFSYRCHKRAVPFVIPANEEDKHVAPERINFVVAAHTAQDVWSVGATLESYTRSSEHLFNEVLKAFPSIDLFLTISRCADYRTRPTLPDFINVLRDEINHFKNQLRCSRR